MKNQPHLCFKVYHIPIQKNGGSQTIEEMKTLLDGSESGVVMLLILEIKM